MKRIAGVATIALKLIDALLLATSPLAIILFLVCVMVILERTGSHLNFVGDMEQEGVVTTGTVAYLPYEADRKIQIHFVDNASQQRTGFLDRQQYQPQDVAQLTLGKQIEVRYLPPLYEDDVVWEEHFDTVQGYFGYLNDVLMISAVCWAMIVIHPEFLYFFFNPEVEEIVKKWFGPGK